MVTAIEVERGKCDLDEGVSAVLTIDLALPFPLFNGHGRVLDPLDEGFRAVKYCLPECVDAWVSIIEDYASNVLGKEKAECSPCASCIRFDVYAISQSVDLHDLGEKVS